MHESATAISSADILWYTVFRARCMNGLYRNVRTVAPQLLAGYCFHYRSFVR